MFIFVAHFLHAGFDVGVDEGTAVYLNEVAACGGDVIGVDWRLPLDMAWEKIGFDRAIQGNLDPVALLTPWPELKKRVDDVLGEQTAVPDTSSTSATASSPTSP